ncbi:MAG: OmpA family protein [Candidatus Kapabacteria bacterium]|nr:OmpA family protein [Candidatus Kapabacteria bacterium]
MIRNSRQIVFITLILCTLSAHAQNEAGIIAGGAFNIHNAQFGKLGTYPSCCPEFTGGSGMGFYVGGWYGVQLNDRFRFLGRLTFSTENGTMTDEERSFVADLRDTAKVIDAMFTHQIDATLTSLGIEPLIAFRAVGGLDVLLGARVGLTMTTTFHQTETLTKPEDYGAYLGDDRVWVDTQADIPGASSIRATIVTGLRYVLPIGRGRSTFLAPELTYHFPLTGVASGVSWSVSQLRFGIALGWQFFPAPPVDSVVPPPAFVAPPPPVVIVPPPYLTIRASGLMPDGTVIPNPVVHIEETQVTTLHPLLGYVYFDNGSSEIPQRYINGIARANADTIGLTPLEAAHGELAIIAQRAKASPKAMIKITGNTSGIGADNGLPLARSRAEGVSDKLVELGVERSRISVNARTSPLRPTKANDPEMIELAAEENRRVEISSSDPSLTGPVSLGSVDISVDPATLRLETTILASGGLQSATLSLRQGSRLLFEEDQQDASKRRKDIQLLSGNPREFTESPLIATITASDSLNKTASSSDTIQVQQLTVSRKRVEQLGDTQIERFELVLFDFNDVSINAENTRLLDYVRSRMRTGTRVRVIGATDIMGSEEYNRDLSLRRAREVARLLGVSDATVEGYGEDRPTFPNDLPEGRAYNRTVVIELVYPVR